MHGLPPQVHQEGKELHCEFDGVETVAKEDGRFCCVPVTHKVTLGEIVDLLERFLVLGLPIEVIFPGFIVPVLFHQSTSISSCSCILRPAFAS